MPIEPDHNGTSVPIQKTREIAGIMVGIQEAFTADHRRLDRLFEAAKRDLPGNTVRAGTAFSLFCQAIERHMATEETHLFPAYEQRHGLDNPLTAILRKGHKDLRAFFEEISEAIAGGDAQEAGALMDVVAQILQHHDEKEERELYPVMAALSPSQAVAVAALTS
ncbi:MAG: hemerythrin domain-containing protein [Acidiferrobacteraceae bacterium]